MSDYSLYHAGNQTPADVAYDSALERYFEGSVGGTLAKLRSFTKYVPRAELGRFLAKSALFDKVLEVHGHIIECGVFLGAGLMTWAQLSSIYEPVNHIRRVVGFDTFAGFPGVAPADAGGEGRPGMYAAPALADLEECVRLYDMARPLGHIPRVEIVPGDATATVPRYVEDNPHLVVALLYLDFDLYEPTKIAIETFLPRMPKGAILAFDELGQKQWPGETRAVLDTVGLGSLRIRRFPHQPQMSYAVIE
jgi:hypothetical protein